MRIAIDSGPLRTGDSVRGIGVYTRELVSELEKIQKTGSDKFDLHPVGYFSHQPSVINHQSSAISHYDIIHFTRFNPFRISIPFKKPVKAKFVLTIYDLIPLIYPDHYPPGVRGWINWQINKYLIKKNIDAVITISETSKKDICRFIEINPKKVFVTHLAPRPVFKRLEIDNFTKQVGYVNWKVKIAKRYRLPERFALYVGDINYNKNIPNLIKACKAAGIKLVIVGKQAAEAEMMNLDHPELRHLKGVDWKGVIRTGFVSDEDLVKIYNLADIYIQPSLYEGFGLPLLEAQSAGIPVIASKTQALIEIAENSALFFDAKNVEDLADKIRLLLNNQKVRSDLSKNGLGNAGRFSWRKTAKLTMEVYRCVSL